MFYLCRTINNKTINKMKITSAIKKVSKALNVEPIKRGQFYRFEYGKECLEFAQNGSSDEITCISTCRIGDESCAMTDYFPNIWHNNVTQAIKFIIRHGK